MFYYAAKIISFLILPSNAALVLGLIGLLASFTRRFQRFGRFLMGFSILAFAVMGLSPLGSIMIAPLEERFPPPAFAASDDLSPANPALPKIAGIIVLGGAVDTHISTTRHETALTDSAERMTAVAGLSRQFPDAKIVFTGGVGSLAGQIWGDISEADASRQLFRSFGIPDERMLFENRSRDTYENAEFTYAMLKPQPGQRYLLVTSGYHMPRSMALFRKAGFDVIAYPVNYRTAGPEDALRPFYSMSDGLRQCNLAAREWFGLLAYRLSGRIDDILPNP
ncbi:membrane protein [Labrys miyagiensis]|uniref:Membrane protein n=1 Tax=Labrys miyagiensis TaxID=346912 RepID=A0ABQ6CEJ3_9HYPH|nr:YdcF family protein [Labrys miyagiensis]GLS17230.1 membrane protein [Labrys miyagiensis]